MQHSHHPLRAQLFGSLTCLALTVVLAACSNSTPGSSTPSGYQRGQWGRPTFGASQPISLTAIAFAAPDQRIGYACVSTLPQSATSVANPNAPSEATPTPTLDISGRPTPPTTTPTIENTFWRTANGGVSWTNQTIPPGLPDLLCPASTIVLPDARQPQMVYLLAGQGKINLTTPAPTLPSQITYQLWASLNGGLAWQAIPLPTLAGTNQPILLSPYHLVLIVNGKTIALASNLSGANALYTTIDAGVTWARHSANELQQPGAPTSAGRLFAGFAAGANGTLFALATSAGIAATPRPYELWQSPDTGLTWARVGALPITYDTSATTANSQIFAAADGKTLYTVVQSVLSAQSSTVLIGSTDGGLTWTAPVWPASPTITTAQAGGTTIAALGTNFAIDGYGTAYFAPNSSDLALAQDPQAQQSAGIYHATIAAGTLNVQLAVAPPIVVNTIGALAVSLIAPEALVTPTAGAGAASTLPTATTIPTATPLPTATATPDPAAAITPIPTPSAAATVAPKVAITGIPVLWANFGPSTLFVTQPDRAGFFWNVLP